MKTGKFPLFYSRRGCCQVFNNFKFSAMVIITLNLVQWLLFISVY